jgi:hypothetical protein
VSRGRVRDAGGPHARAGLDTLSAPRAGVDHAGDAVAENHLEGDFVHRR